MNLLNATVTSESLREVVASRPTSVSTIGPEHGFQISRPDDVLSVHSAARRRLLRLLSISSFRLQRELIELSGFFEPSILEPIVLSSSTLTRGLLFSPGDKRTIVISDSATINAEPFISWPREVEEATSTFFVSPPPRPVLFEARLDVDRLPRREPTPVVEDYPDSE